MTVSYAMHYRFIIYIRLSYSYFLCHLFVRVVVVVVVVGVVLLVNCTYALLRRHVSHLPVIGDKVRRKARTDHLPSPPLLLVEIHFALIFLVKGKKIWRSNGNRERPGVIKENYAEAEQNHLMMLMVIMMIMVMIG